MTFISGVQEIAFKKHLTQYVMIAWNNSKLVTSTKVVKRRSQGFLLATCLTCMAAEVGLDCFNEAESGDDDAPETSLTENKHLPPVVHTFPSQCLGDATDLLSPTAVHGANVLSDPNRVPTKWSKDVTLRSNRGAVEQSSSRSVAKSASKRMGKEEASRVMASALHTLRVPDIGPTQVELSARNIRDLIAGNTSSINDLETRDALGIILRLAESSHHTGAAEQACRLAADVCEKSVEGRTTAAGFVPFFCDLIKMYNTTYVSVTEGAVRALGAVCASGSVVPLKGGVGLICSAMRRWKETRSMQCACCKAIEQCCFDGNEENRSELSDFGGIQEVTACLFYYADDSKIQSHAIYAIIAISQADATAREEFGAAGALQAVSAAINTFGTQHLGIASHSALAVRNLCLHACNRERFSEHMPSLLFALRSISRRERELHTIAHRDGIANCYSALITCLTGHERNRQTVTDGLDDLTRVAQFYSDDSRIVGLASYLFKCIFRNGQAIHLYRQRKAAGIKRLLTSVSLSRDPSILSLIDVSIGFLLRHKTHASIVQDCCVLYNSFIQAGYSKALVGHARFHSLLEELRRTVEIHSNNEGVVKESLTTYALLRNES